MTPDPHADADETALFETFDRYVSLVQAGDREQAAALERAHPELAQVAGCLADLDDFARSARGGPGADQPAGNGVETSESDAAATAATLPPGVPPALQAGEAPGAPFARDFGRYELLEEVGRGGMGVVYKARQRDLERTVALKMILSSQLAAADDIKRFYREARAAGQLRHPHIVGIHEVGQVHGQHYFAMEYVAGTSLAGLLRAGPLDPEQAARCLAAVARAVEYLHAHGIVHRDLKPSNILIDEAGSPLVTDFGLAKIFQEDDERTQTGVILGTPGYMAPEQASGRVSEITAQSDVYSLGAILYEMLCGRPPFREDNPLNTLLQVLESEPTRPLHLNPRIPPELERICLRCLEKLPDGRYASAQALADELDRYLRQEPLETPPESFVDRVRRWVRRDTGFVARLSILIAVAGIIEVQHLLSHRHWTYHIEIKLVFALWTALAFVFQRMLRRPRTAEAAKFAWALTDPVLLTVVLKLAENEIGPLMIGYPLIVAASGLWFSVRLVAVSTVAGVASFAALLLLRHDPTNQPHYPVIFAAALAVIGGIVAFQVQRVRTLSRYFEQTTWPRDR